MTIFIVDEDAIQLEPFKVELEIRGFKVEFILDADEAFKALSKVSNDQITLAIIDVMLAVNVKRGLSKFDRIETNDFLKTGLILIEKLAELNPEIFPQKALFFSNATNQELVMSIEEEAEKYQIPYLDKSNYQSPLAFGDIIEEIIKKIDG